MYYSSKLKMGQLKAQCRERGLKVGGKKGEMVTRLENDDQQLQESSCHRCVMSTWCFSDGNWHPWCSRLGDPVLASSPARSPTRRPTTTHVASQISQTDASNNDGAEINPAQVLAETEALENYFQYGFANGQEMNNDEGGDSDDGGTSRKVLYLIMRTRKL